jgi:hypothetical protein
VYGITDDDHVVCGSSETVVSALPASGGAGVAITTGSFQGALVVHDVVFVWADSGLLVWSAGMTAARPVASSSLAGMAAASADSSSIAFSCNASQTGSTTDLCAANLGDLGSPTTIASGVDSSYWPNDVDLGTGACSAPVLKFVGTSPARLVASFCMPSDAGGDSPGVLVSYSSSGWAPVVLDTELSSQDWVNGFWTDTSDSTVAFVASDELQIVSATGGTVTDVDGITDENFGIDRALWVPPVYLSRNGDFVVYATGQAVRRSTVAAPAPVTLLASGAEGLGPVSPDESWAFGIVAYDETSLEGLRLVSLTPGATQPGVLATPPDSVLDLYGDAFTADSKYALFAIGGAEFELWATPTGMPSANPVMVTDTAFGTYHAIGGSRLALLDNVQTSTTQESTGDLETVDLSSTGLSLTLVAHSVTSFAVSPDQKYLAYAGAQGVRVVSAQ